MNEPSSHSSGTASTSGSNTPPPRWKKAQPSYTTKSSYESSAGGISMGSNMPSTSRFADEYRLNNEYNCDTSTASSSCDTKCSASTSTSSLSMMKDRSSLSNLGGSSTAIDGLTNTRRKSITNRRGAVKYQKYVF